jgi:hypothetical protein
MSVQLLANSESGLSVCVDGSHKSSRSTTLSPDARHAESSAGGPRLSSCSSPRLTSHCTISAANSPTFSGTGPTSIAFLAFLRFLAAGLRSANANSSSRTEKAAPPTHQYTSHKIWSAQATVLKQTRHVCVGGGGEAATSMLTHLHPRSLPDTNEPPPSGVPV